MLINSHDGDPLKVIVVATVASSEDEEVTNISPELTTFVGKDSYFLLIKGNSGTGKTALALSILEQTKRKGKFLYICTRTSPASILQDHPWLQRKVGVSEGGPKHGVSSLQTEEGLFVDGRLDEPIPLFDRITGELMDEQAPTIVIDSWDAVREMMDREAHSRNVKVLQTWRDRSSARLILVTENLADASFDYLVEGVVTLSRRSLEGRPLREMLLKKLVGVEISRTSYFYTLRQSRFRCFESYRIEDAELVRRGSARAPPPKPRQVAGQATSKTGFRELDAILRGGFPHESVVSLEMDPGVDGRVPAMFLSSITQAMVNSGGRVLLGAFDFVDPRYLRALLGSTIPPSQSGRYHVWPHDSELGLGARPDLRTAKERMKSFLAEAVSARRRSLRGRNVAAVSIDIEGLGDDRGLSADFLRQTTSLFDLLLVAWRSSPGGRVPAPVSDVRLKLANRKGTLLFYSVSPWSKIYGMSTERYGGVPHLRFTPVV
jgi:KaiC/GvpD/RAD55 family RecA-like ATPase